MQAPSTQVEPGQAPPVLEEKLESKVEQTPTGQGVGVKNTHAATSKLVARAKRGTSKCPECGKIFRWSNSMRRHQRNHTGERPYKCPDCGKTFKGFSSLISLHRIHKGERPYKCLECGECFTLPDQLPPHHAPADPCTGELPHVPVLWEVIQRGRRVYCPSEAPLGGGACGPGSFPGR